MVAIENFTREDIVIQLNKILSSTPICNSSVLTEFLKYIVTETLEGRSNELKESIIGVTALRREIDFNPKSDSIVSIAGRLNCALNDYYHDAGKDDLLLISIPKGSYVPLFDRRLSAEAGKANGEPPAKKPLDVANGNSTEKNIHTMINLGSDEIPPSHKPTIAVLPFRYLGSARELEYFAASLSEYLSTELTQFNDLKVVSFYAGKYADKSTDLQELGQSLGAEYLVTGSAQISHRRIRIYIQLSSSSTGNQLWAHTFEKSGDEDKFLVTQEEVVNNTLAFITGVNGIIWRHEFSATKIQSHRTPDQVSYWYYRYAKNFDRATIVSAKNFYEDIVKREPKNALAIAYLSEILAGEAMLPDSKPEKVNRGLAFAHLAMKTDPQCQQAYQSLAIHLLALRDCAECVRVLNEGLTINPKSADYRGAMGALMIFAGEFEQGIKLLDSVASLNPGMTWWHVISYSFYSYYRKFYSDALFWIDRVQMNVIWKPIIQAASYAQLNRLSEARSILMQMKIDYPSVDLLQEDTLNHFFHSEALVNELKNGIMKVNLN